MGLMGVQENGTGEMGLSGVSLGSKNKYKRMDSDMKEDEDDGASLHHHHHQEEDRKRSTRKYVFACAVFASLNSVLLGYGMLFFWMIYSFQHSWILLKNHLNYLHVLHKYIHRHMCMHVYY